MSRRQYCKFIANDKSEFILETKIARQCPYFQERMGEHEDSTGKLIEFKFDNISSEVMTAVISYLHFRERYSFDLKAQIPEFFIDPDQAYELLKATQFLKI